jgi:hypothetical protein
MTTQQHKHSNKQSDSPIPPIPPIGPPSGKLKGFWASITVLFASAGVFALKTAYQVCSHFMTWDNFTDLSAWTKIAKLTFNGFVYGLIPGSVFGLLTIAIALAGPQLWGYLGPIILAAAARTMSFIRGMSLAVRGLPAPPQTRDDGKEDNG